MPSNWAAGMPWNISAACSHVETPSIEDGVHDAVQPDHREWNSPDGAWAVVVGDLALDHGPIALAHLAGEVEAEVCPAREDADGASGHRHTDVPPPVALQAPSVSIAARAIPAAPIRRTIRRRGDT